MKPRGMHLSWIVVTDIKAAIKFYKEVVGLELAEYHEQYGWAELTAGGEDGMRLGIAQHCQEKGMKAGANAIVTVTVDDIASAREDLQKKGACLIGEVVEVPGEVKMQTFCDSDGNTLQICQLLRKPS